MPVEQNQITPDISHEALKEALKIWDINKALQWQSEISSAISRKTEENIVWGYEFVCKMINLNESFPNSPNLTGEMCMILDNYLAV